MNGIKGKKTYGIQCNIPIDAVVKILKYNKNTIDHATYFKFFYEIVSYLTVSNVRHILHNSRKSLGGILKLKIQEVSIFYY